MCKVRWIVLYGFCSKFRTLYSSAKILNIGEGLTKLQTVKRWELFLRHNVVWHWLTFGWRALLLWICTLHTQPQPLYGPFSGTTQVSRCQKIFFWTFYGAREDNRGRHTNHPTGRHSIRTNQLPTCVIPPFFYRPDALPAITFPLYRGLG